MDISSAPTETPPISVPAVNGSAMNRQPISLGNVPIATVKAEPTTLTSEAYPHVPSHPRPAYPHVPQEMISSGDGGQELKPIVSNMSQSLHPVNPAAANVSIQNNLFQARQVMSSAALTGGASIGIQAQNSMAMHMSNVIFSGMQSSIPAAQNVHSSGQSSISSITGSGVLSGPQQAVQNPPPASFTSATSNMTGNSNLGLSQSSGNLQGGVIVGQSVSRMSQGTLTGTQIVQNGAGMNPSTMSGLVPSSISSGTGTLIPNPGLSEQVQPGIQSLGMSNSLAATMPLSQQASTSALQFAQSEYVKVWEGALSGQRQGQPVFITRLEGYRRASASETLAANWPATMQIVRLISQDHMNNKQYFGKTNFLVFRALTQHGFLGQLKEKKLCAVIQLPSQTLLLSVSDKACRLIGMLFRGDEKEQVYKEQRVEVEAANAQSLIKVTGRNTRLHHNLNSKTTKRGTKRGHSSTQQKQIEELKEEFESERKKRKEHEAELEMERKERLAQQELENKKRQDVEMKFQLLYSHLEDKGLVSPNITMSSMSPTNEVNTSSKASNDQTGATRSV